MGEGAPEMFHKPVPKGPCQLTNVRLLTACLGTFEPIDYHTFIGDIVLVFGGHQEVPEGISSLNIHLYCHFITKILETFTMVFGGGNNYVDVSCVVEVIDVISPIFPGIVLGLISTEPMADVNL